MGDLRFAILGCGRISLRHAESLQNIKGAKLVACADVAKDRAAQLAQRYQIRPVDSLDALLAWGDFDVACVCTPSGSHAENAVAIMKNGKHVVVEKPMALRVQHADLMIQTALANQVKLFVVKQNRYNRPVMALRRALDQGRFGKLVMGTVRVRWMRDQNYYNQDPWRGKWASDGGVFSNQASHHIDLLEWCMGEVDTVYAKTATQLVDIECEDTGIAVLKFKSGALGLIEATTATRPRDLEGSLSILGEKGSVEIAGFAVNELRHFHFAPPLPDDEEIIRTCSVNPPNVYGFGHQAFLQNVVDTLRGEAQPLVDGIEGKKSLEFITALYASSESGKEIQVRAGGVECQLGKSAATS